MRPYLLFVVSHSFCCHPVLLSSRRDPLLPRHRIANAQLLVVILTLSEANRGRTPHLIRPTRSNTSLRILIPTEAQAHTCRHPDRSAATYLPSSRPKRSAVERSLCSQSHSRRYPQNHSHSDLERSRSETLALSLHPTTDHRTAQPPKFCSATPPPFALVPPTF
jgi:hypothetical protein